MSSRKKRLNKAILYLILDTQVLSYKKLLACLKPAVRLGVDIVQLRDKNGAAQDILDFCKAAKKQIQGKALFIVNDRIDLALLAKADGVHLGQQDIPYQKARKMMGPKAIIGVSCQTLEQAREAEVQGADYIGFGSVFKTKTKPDRKPMDPKLLKKVLATIKIPVFPIGGIELNNVRQVTGLGAKRVAVCRDILLAKNLEKTVKEFKNKLSKDG
jgi:thiamine-phosphate pyrophosphorylase